VIFLLRESLKLSFDSLKHRKVSFGLTILGITIGIAAIVGLISVGEGLKTAISQQLEQFGADKIMIVPSFSGSLVGSALLGEPLSDEDVKTVERVSGVEMAVGILVKTLPVEYRDEIETTFVSGLPAKESEKFFSEIQSFRLDEGRYFASNEESVAVLGWKAANDVFERKVGIGDSIKIKGEKLKVIGILKSIGNPTDDKSVILPLDTLRKITGNRDELTMILAKADVSRINSIASSIERKLNRKYGKNTFMAITSEQIMERVGSIFSILSFILGGIASIALIVAGVGVSNTMLTSVIERTREIGIMKAIGATNTNILEIFLIESALLGFIGGVIGCIVGSLFSSVVSFFASQMLSIRFEAVVTPQIILLAIAFSTVVGVVSGFFPARRAAKLQPVEALRYE
jgi:putative ABC transport system permease protein